MLGLRKPLLKLEIIRHAAEGSIPHLEGPLSDKGSAKCGMDPSTTKGTVRRDKAGPVLWTGCEDSGNNASSFDGAQWQTRITVA